MAPFTPFFTEILYQNLRKLLPPENVENAESVHYLSFPSPQVGLCFPTIEQSVSRMQKVIELGRLARDRRKKPLKTPLAEMIVHHKNIEFIADIQSLEHYILKEMNVKKIIYKWIRLCTK